MTCSDLFKQKNLDNIRESQNLESSKNIAADLLQDMLSQTSGKTSAPKEKVI